MSAGGIGIGWQIGSTFGWGIYGLQIALHMLRGGRGTPVLFEEPSPILHLSPIEALLLDGPLRQRGVLREQIKKHGDGPLATPIPVLRAHGNDAEPAFADVGRRLRGSADHGLIFFEDTRFSPGGLDVLARYRSVVAGSSWNRDVLAAAGLADPLMCIQGIDPSVFHPAPRVGLLGDRFVIFAGGKLEFRKGQDIAVAAVRAFRERHPDTFLITAWHNYWPKSIGVQHFRHSRVLDAAPEVDEAQNRVRVDKWLIDNGIPEGSFLVLNDVSPTQMARLMREADVGLFPNRCEGGTNLVAMECMACGIPTVLSRNTGHLDITAPGACLPLHDQAPVPPPGESGWTEGWGESSVEEIVETLEAVYRDRAAARAVGERGAAFMSGFSWANQTAALFDMLGIGRAS